MQVVHSSKQWSYQIHKNFGIKLQGYLDTQQMNYILQVGAGLERGCITSFLYSRKAELQLRVKIRLKMVTLEIRGAQLCYSFRFISHVDGSNKVIVLIHGCIRYLP
jgi:hypothetical protein